MSTTREYEIWLVFWRIFRDAAVANRLLRVAEAYWSGARAG